MWPRGAPGRVRFGTIFVLNDRRVLDRQLSATVERFLSKQPEMARGDVSVQRASSTADLARCLNRVGSGRQQVVFSTMQASGCVEAAAAGGRHEYTPRPCTHSQAPCARTHSLIPPIP